MSAPPLYSYILSPFIGRESLCYMVLYGDLDIRINSKSFLRELYMDILNKVRSAFKDLEHTDLIV